MSVKSVAITGIGIVSPLGHDKESTWQQLMNQQSGIGHIQSFDASYFPTQIAAEVKGFDASSRVPKRLQKYTTSFTNFALAAAEEAFDDAGIKPTVADNERWGCITGAGMMTTEYEYLERFTQTFFTDKSIDWVKYHHDFESFYQSQDFGKTIANSGLALLTQNYQIRGFSTSVHTACASGGQALGLALKVLNRGDADKMLVGGFDSMINPIGVSSFCLLGALSSDNDNPHRASRPFDKTRGGFVLGEGAAFLILEDVEAAKKRGAKIYALLAGEGNSLSSYRITDSHPSGDGATQAIQGALTSAGLSVNDIDYINAHGTSTKMNDLSETNAIKAVFSDQAYKVPVSSTKSLTGHLIAAAGALEGALTSLAIYHQKAPMTANLTTPDPECDLDYITEGPRELSIKAALSHSFGFGGSNSCLAFKSAREVCS